MNTQSPPPSYSAKSPMRGKLFKFGVGVTVVWLTVGVAILLCASDRASPLKPNEWGDVFAGLFAPVAFLWLVLGFLQQGQELQLSTRALELQVTELKNSVEQQRDLVEVTRRQVLATLQEQERSRAAELAATQPRFLLSLEESTYISAGFVFRFRMENEGETATDVRVQIVVAETNVHESHFATVSRDQRVRFDWTSNETFPQSGVTINIGFYDINLKFGQVSYFAVYVPVGTAGISMQFKRRAIPA